MDDGISGSVKLRFVVNVQGNISDIKVLEENKSCPEFTKEAIRVIRQSPKWIPAQIKGKSVNSWMMIPVRFNLELRLRRFTLRCLRLRQFKQRCLFLVLHKN